MGADSGEVSFSLIGALFHPLVNYVPFFFLGYGWFFVCVWDFFLCVV